MLDELAENEEIISRAEIEESMQAEKAQCLQIESDGRLVAGAVVQVNEQAQRNSLDFAICSNRRSWQRFRAGGLAID